MAYCEIPDVDSITALPVLTEDEIFNPVINPPLSYEDLSDWYFQEFQPVVPPSRNPEIGAGAEDLPDWYFQELQPMDEFDTDVEETLALNSVRVHLEATNVMLPICHPVAVCEELRNVGISQAVEQQEEPTKQEEPTRQERSQIKGRLMAEPEIGLEDPQLLMARSRTAKLIEFVKKHSNQLYPSVLPGSFRHELSCMKPEPDVIAPVDYPPVQHSSLPSPAPKVEQCDAIPLPALEDSFSIPTTLLQPQPLVPFLESSTMVGNMIYDLAETVTHTNVDMIEITQSEAQVEITTPCSPTIHDLVDLSSPVMTASADLEVSFTPQTLGFSGASSVAHESGSECQLNGSDIWLTKTVSDWCKNYSNAIDHTPAIPPPDLEFASSVIVTPVEIPEVMEADTPTRELELVPNLVVPKKIRRWKNRLSVERLLPSLEATFEPMKPKKLRKTKQQQVAGTTSAGENENHAPVVKHRIVWTEDLQKRFEEALTLLGGLGSHEAIPRNVCYVMNCKSMTRCHVKSRLQRCQKYPEDGNEGSSELASDGSQLPHMRGSKRRRRGLKASSSELPDQQAAQQTLAGTMAMHQEMQQQLPELMERSMELQAHIDVIAKQGEQLQQMSQEMLADQQIIIILDD